MVSMLYPPHSLIIGMLYPPHSLMWWSCIKPWLPTQPHYKHVVPPTQPDVVELRQAMTPTQPHYKRVVPPTQPDVVELRQAMTPHTALL